MHCFPRPSLLLALAFGLLFFVEKLSAQAIMDTVQAKAALREGERLRYKGDYAASFEKTMAAYEAYLRLLGPEHPETLQAKKRFGVSQRNVFKWEEAGSTLEECLHSFEARHDTGQVMHCLIHLTAIRSSQRRFAEAHRFADKGIALAQADSLRHARSLLELRVKSGTAYLYENNFLAALPLLQKAQILSRALNSPLDLSIATYWLASTYEEMGDYARAKEQRLEGISIEKSIPPAEWDSVSIAELCASLSICCHKTDEPELALRYLREAEEMYPQSRRAKDLRYATFLRGVAGAYQAQGEMQKAIEVMARSTAQLQQKLGSEHIQIMVNERQSSALCLDAGLLEEAEAHLRNAMRIAAKIPEKFAGAYRFQAKLAEIRLRQGRWPEALAHCDTAFALCGFDEKHLERVLPRDGLRALCQAYAQALWQQWETSGDMAALARSEHFFGLAAQILLREVAEQTLNSSQEISLDRDHAVLERWLDARMTLFAKTGAAAHLDTAFQIAAQSKAFVLSQIMHESGALQFAGVPDTVLQAEIGLRKNIAELEKKLSAASSDSLLLQTNGALLRARERYDALMAQASAKWPEYARLRQARSTVALADLCQKHLAPGQALLMYSLTERAIYAFVLRREGLSVRTLPPDASLDATVADFRRSLTEYYASPDPADALYDQSLAASLALGQSLYERLVAPLADLLPRRVVIVPEGALCHLSFEALLSARPSASGNFSAHPFWGKEKSISYCFSTDLLAEMSRPPAPRPTAEWLGIAPFFDEKNEATAAASRADFAPLPFSGEEVRGISALLGSSGAIWLGAAADWPHFQQQAARYRALHLATHSRADDRRGDNSFFALAGGAPVSAKDLYSMRLSAEMVVLSACEAGMGRLRRGEGIIGLTRALAFAGARSVVNNMWVANDRSASELMLEFYRQLRRGQPKDEAMRLARLQLMAQNPAAAHPFFWAGFRVVGGVGPIW